MCMISYGKGFKEISLSALARNLIHRSEFSSVPASVYVFIYTHDCVYVHPSECVHKL